MRPSWLGEDDLGPDLARTHRAVRLCPDDWLDGLGVDLWDEPFRARLEARLAHRNAVAPPGRRRFTRAELAGWSRLFERPDAAERALFDR